MSNGLSARLYLETRLKIFLTKQVWAEKSKFGTSFGEIEGHNAIVALVEGVHKKFPGSKVRRTSKIDGFGNYLRFGFILSQPDGKPILGSVDFATIVDGKLQLVMVFSTLRRIRQINSWAAISIEAHLAVQMREY